MMGNVFASSFKNLIETQSPNSLNIKIQKILLGFACLDVLQLTTLEKIGCSFIFTSNGSFNLFPFLAVKFKKIKDGPLFFVCFTY